jgi:hypothetical protein
VNGFSVLKHPDAKMIEELPPNALIRARLDGIPVDITVRDGKLMVRAVRRGDGLNVAHPVWNTIVVALVVEGDAGSTDVSGTAATGA